MEILCYRSTDVIYLMADAHRQWSGGLGEVGGRIVCTQSAQPTTVCNSNKLFRRAETKRQIGEADGRKRLARIEKVSEIPKQAGVAALLPNGNHTQGKPEGGHCADYSSSCRCGAPKGRVVVTERWPGIRRLFLRRKRFAVLLTQRPWVSEKSYAVSVSIWLHCQLLCTNNG